MGSPMVGKTEQALQGAESAFLLGSWVLAPGPLHGCSYKSGSMLFRESQRYVLSVTGTMVIHPQLHLGTRSRQFDDSLSEWGFCSAGV